MNDTCNGIQVSGYWKGYPCGASAKFKASDGKMYCHSHYAVAENNPERFTKAISDREKWKSRQSKNKTEGK